MNQIFRPNQKIVSKTGVEYLIKDFLGDGTQGEVYRISASGKELALKWYKEGFAKKEQWDILQNLISLGSPTPKFLWPLELMEIKNIPGFGYIMPLRGSNFKGLIDLMKGRIDPGFNILITAGFELADSYFHLHSMGLCYSDINFGNAFFDPNDGKVLICDNDNVVVNKSDMSSVMGTPYFMAPEIVRGEARPSRDTDLYSLSVLLFYMFHISHPLEGKKQTAIHAWDYPAMVKIFGKEPVFIFDPNNDSNRPDPAVHKHAETYWKIYPKFLKNLFIRAFTDGLKDPENGRVQENEWRSALIRLRDSIIYCQKCSSENFYDLDAIREDPSYRHKCWNCKSEISIPARIKINSLVKMLNYNTVLYQHHLDGMSYNFDEKVAQMTPNPKNPDIWGLKNLTNVTWVAEKLDGAKIEVKPGQSISIISGLIIDFGTSKGEIRD